MVAFDIDVYYVGKEIEELKYGQHCMLDYCYNKDKNTETIEIFSYETFYSLLRITNVGQTDTKSHKKLFGCIGDFVDEDDWYVINRDRRLSLLLED